MDSLTHLALGAATSMAVMGPGRARRAAVWGAVFCTLPDLDVFLPHADAISGMVNHRAETHALFWQLLAAPVLGWLVSRLHGERELFGRWTLAALLGLWVHSLLDAFTVYGTKLGLPFTDHAFALGSIFIIDPLYTLPLLVGVWMGLKGRPRAASMGLLLSSAYLAWGLAAQTWVEHQVRASLAVRGIAEQAQVLVTPAPFNSLVWRVVVVEPDHYHEGWASVFDPKASEQPLAFDRYVRGGPLLTEAGAHPGVRQLAQFARGFVALQEREGRLWLTDLRMGREPGYFFRFDLGPKAEALSGSPPATVQHRDLMGFGEALAWMVRRVWDASLPAPGRASAY